MLVNGRVETPSGSGGSFAGHRILLTYRRVVGLAAPADPAEPADPTDTGPTTTAPVPPDGPSDEVEIPDAASALLAGDGGFQLALRDEGEIRSPVEAAILAPTGEALARKTFTSSQLQSELKITAAPVDPIIVLPSSTPGLGQAQRLTGRVIGYDGRAASTGLPLVIYGLDQDAQAAARPLLSLKTQVGGYFSGDWPSDSLVSAYAVVGNQRSAVSLVGGQMPQRVILVLDLPAVEDDCGCTPTPPRAPDQGDLVRNSEAFSQDLGAGCLNLTMPNRVIEEYPYFTIVRITEPSVRPMNTEPVRRIPPGLLTQIAELSLSQRVFTTTARTAHATEAAEGPGAGVVSPAPVAFGMSVGQARELIADPSLLTPSRLHTASFATEATDLNRMIDLLGARPTRWALDGQHSIDWDATPTVYEATTVALGHVLHFRQVWRADGYSLGDLLYSLPLAPGQKRQVSMLDWTRRATGARSEELESEEQMRALAERGRDIAEIVGSHLDERVDGGSSSSSSAAGGGIGAGFIGAGFGVLAGVAGGASSSSSSSWQDSSRDLAGNSLQQLRDRTTQRANSVRSTRSTVVQTVAQGESVRAETEVVANHNHCHAITVEYFEVLRHFQVAEELAYVSECVFVPLPMLPFGQAKARRWRATLLEGLRRPDLAGGFDAIDRIVTNWDGWDYPEHRFSEEAPEELEGELRVSFVIPRPHDNEDGEFQIDAWNWVIPFLWTSPFGVFNAMSDSVNSYFRDINRKMTAEFYTQIQRARDDYFAREVAPRIAEQIAHRMRFAYVTKSGGQVSLPMDASLISKYVDGVPLYVSIRAAGGLPALPREEIRRFRISIDDTLFAGFPFSFEVVPAEARILVTSAKARYATPHLSHLLFDDGRVNNDLSDGDDVLVATPTEWEERKDPRAEDRRAADQLVKHLNEHLEYYHQVIWSSLDPQRRFMLLDGVIAPNAGGRSIASVVENRLIAIVGNCMVLPVTPGIHLDPTLTGDPETGERVDLIHAYAAEPAPPTRISVPTRGVYAEAISGECDSCEKKDDTRFWRWEESPLPDEPTAIDPISTESRAAAEADATPTPLPSPIVTIQNAPALPDPLGLSQAMEILGRSDIFREASGLAGTQRNALSAFQGVMDTAKSFGGMAASLASQQEMGRTVDRTLEQIKSAQNSGMLSQQQASELTHAALQSLAGDSGAEHENPVHNPDVGKAIEKAVESQSGSVKVTAPGETVSASFDDTDPGAAVGGALSPKIPPVVETWLDIPLAFDGQQAGSPGVVTYVRLAAVDKLSTLRTQAALLDVRPTIAYDFFPGMKAANLVREHPTRADGFQVGLRMQICYPAEAGKTGIGGSGRLPLVVLAHGRHRGWRSPTPKPAPSGTATITTSSGPVAIPVHEVELNDPVLSLNGYTYLQQELARQGIVSVSVDARLPDHMNHLIESRADLIIGALDYLARESQRAGSDYFGRLDMDNVGLMGHSRGGDAVVRAAKRVAATAGKRYTIKAVCSLSPTDFTGDDTPADRAFLDSSDTAFYLVLYGALDGDISGLGGPGDGVGTGFRHYDRARCHKAMAFVAACNHNSFNSIWHADPPLDAPADPEVTHQRLSIEYIGELFRWQLKREPLAGRFDGRTGTSTGVPISLQWLFGTTVKYFDDFEHGSTNIVGGATTVMVHAPDVISKRDETQVTHGSPPQPLGRHMPHQSHMLQLGWESSPRVTGIAAYTSDVPAAHKDWSALDNLLVSLAGYYDPTSLTTIANEWLPRVRLILTDTSGGTGVAQFANYGSLIPSRPTWTQKHGSLSTLMRLETVPVPLAMFPGVDLHKIKKLTIELEPAGIVTTYVDNIHVVKR